MTIHYGNNNWKRKTAKCGIPASHFDSINLTLVNCEKCIIEILKTKTVKKELWQMRLEQIRKCYDYEI